MGIKTGLDRSLQRCVYQKPGLRLPQSPMAFPVINDSLMPGRTPLQIYFACCINFMLAPLRRKIWRAWP